MAKDKTRERKLPNWLEGRTAYSVKASPALQAYHQTDLAWVTCFDKYHSFRQGARVRA
jgi:ribosomal protein L39E